MIKFKDTRTIEYVNDSFPYIQVSGLPEDTVALVEIIDAKKNVSHHFLGDTKQIMPCINSNLKAPKACVIIITGSSTFVRTNYVIIEDWERFASNSPTSPEIRIAMLERRIKDLEIKGANFKQYPGAMVPGAVATVVEGGKILFKLPYEHAITIVNGKAPASNGVLELNMKDFPDLTQFLKVIIATINNINERLGSAELSITDLVDPL